MKLKLTYLLLVFLLTHNLQSQSIPSFWMNIHNLEEFNKTRNKDVEQIVVDKKGYYASGKSYRNKWTYNFRTTNKCEGTLSKDGELASHFSYEYDSLNQRVKIVIKTKIPLMGWDKEIMEFEYVNGKRMVANYYDNNYNIIRTANFKYDSLHHLTQISLDEGYETADYNYEKNSYIYRVFSKDYEIMLEEKNFCHLNEEQEIRNEFGDLTKVVWPTSNPDNKVYHIMEYKYDEHGNWIRRKRFIEKNGKRKVMSKIKRKISYKK